MYPIYFTAILKTEDGLILEEGEACVSETEDAIDFVSSFVPLMKLGVTAKIVRKLGDRELECFTGSVYLSSASLLRIVDVDVGLVTEMRRLFSINENITTDLVFAPGRSVHFNVQKAASISGMVRYLSMDIVKIFSMEYIPDQQYLMFSVETPRIKLNRMMVQVHERILLKRNAAVHICNVVSLSGENRRALAAFTTSKKPLNP